MHSISRQLRRPLPLYGLILAVTLAARTQLQSTGTIEGEVVRFGTSEPIPGVNIELRRTEGTPASPLLPLVFAGGYYSPGARVLPNSPNPADASYATTGSDGKFVFRNLKPGKYRLLAAQPDGTYFAAEFGQRNPRGPGYDFDIADVQSMKFKIEMAGMASITGRVIGADGKPAVHAHVLAAEIAYQNGARILNQVQGVESDERGNYRLFSLPPGKYYVGAFPEGIRRQQTAVPFGPPGNVQSFNQTFSEALIHYRAGANGETLRDVYEIVYAPGQTDPNAANIVDLRLGSDVGGIDISMAAGRHRAVRVRGALIDGSNGQPAPGVSVVAVPRSSGPVNFAVTTTSNADGTFQIDGIMQGEYYLTASFGPPASPQRAIQNLKVESTDIEGINLNLSRGPTITGRITVDGADADGYRVRLSREINGLAGFGSGASAAGVFSIASVEPGSYLVGVTAPAGNSASSIYVKSISMGRVESATGMVQIGESISGTLEIAVSRNTGIVEGSVIDAQRRPGANVMVVLIPADSRRPDFFKMETTDFNGHFRIQGIAPGNYLAYAWPWIQNGLWQYPEFIQSVDRQATRIVISGASTANTDLTLLPEVNF